MLKPTYEHPATWQKHSMKLYVELHSHLQSVATLTLTRIFFTQVNSLGNLRYVTINLGYFAL